MKRQVRTATTSIHTTKVTADELLAALHLPKDACVRVLAPTGGDCSGEHLVIGKDIESIEVRWERSDCREEEA